MIKRGNHKSATSSENSPSLNKNYTKEVSKGWMIPIKVSSVPKLIGARVIPVGVAVQWTINDKGGRIKKRRVTHDCSFLPPSGHSINHDVDQDLLDDCNYGFCLRRVSHSIHSLWFRQSLLRILLTKIDFDVAYRRKHVTPEMAVTAITILDEIAYLLTRLPFGASAGPSKFSTFSEAVFDLIYNLLLD